MAGPAAEVQHPVALGHARRLQQLTDLFRRRRRTLERLDADRERAIALIWEPFSRAELREFNRFARALADGLSRYGPADR